MNLEGRPPICLRLCPLRSHFSVGKPGRCYAAVTAAFSFQPLAPRLVQICCLTPILRLRRISLSVFQNCQRFSFSIFNAPATTAPGMPTLDERARQIVGALRAPHTDTLDSAFVQSECPPLCPFDLWHS
jgi:hypothetical protein